MVEHSAVNRQVGGSSPLYGAIKKISINTNLFIILNIY